MTFAQMQSNLLVWVNSNTSSPFFTDTTSVASYIKTTINYAYNWACGLYDWKFMEKGIGITTASSALWYDYPTSPYIIKTDGVKAIEVDQSATATVDYKRHEKMNFESYQDFLRDNPDDTTTYIFADFDRKIFIHPTPTNGHQMNWWVKTRPADLSADGDVSIFGNNEPDGDYAVMLKAKSIIMEKAEKLQDSQLMAGEAVQVLQRIWDRYTKRDGLSRAEKPFFSTQDYFNSDNVFDS